MQPPTLQSFQEMLCIQLRINRAAEDSIIDHEIGLRFVDDNRREKCKKTALLAILVPALLTSPLLSGLSQR